MLGYGKLLKEARESWNLNQDDVADKIGIDRSLLSKWETENKMPTLDHINPLVAVLPISADQLLRGMGINLMTPAATKLPPELVETLLELDKEELEVVAKIARGLLASRQVPAARR